MSCLRSTRLIFELLATPLSLSLRRARSSPRSFRVSSSNPLPNPTTCLPRRAFSLTARRFNDLFEFTSGRWIVNDELRHAERRLVFNVDGLRRLAADSVKRSPDDIDRLEKLAEGGYNRTFLITWRDGFRMVARVPYPKTVPKHFAVASEVATLAFLRSVGLPTPEVYGYSYRPDNDAGTEYIFMEFVEGTTFGKVLPDLGERDIISILRQLAELEKKMMSMVFPAGGSLYFTEDLVNLAGSSSGPTIRPGVPIKDGRFSIGPETDHALWYGKRSQLKVDRGPYMTADAALVAGAKKEQAYLRQFGRPLLPFRRERRDAYKYQEQQPLDHIENLDRYICIAPSLLSRFPQLNRFGIRHPDLHPDNVMLSWSPDSSSYVVAGLLDWQHTSILPMNLHIGIPLAFQNFYDEGWKCMTTPSLPEKFDELDEIQQRREMGLYRRRLLHYHYVKNTEKYNPLYYAVLMDPVGGLRYNLFDCSRAPWMGETLKLKIALIHATEDWEKFTGHGTPCPLVFDADDIRETKELCKVQTEADRDSKSIRDIVGVGSDDWVPNEHYEEAKRISQEMKEEGIAAMKDEDPDERALAVAHYPLDDMNEEDYM
ncbi:protein kinase subdomain-containing protein PKL/CAK/Fmp29 [Crassisporium funariophilum]|nr:protein kinase subdomain-containing protein PKL/CAK/Fmp29 [Crassisporium funariophilum]